MAGVCTRGPEDILLRLAIDVSGKQWHSLKTACTGTYLFCAVQDILLVCTVQR